MEKAGFFRGDPAPLDSIRKAMGEQADRGRVVAYLASGELLVGSPGLDSCLLGDERVEVHVLTDGQWIWPAELAHYVEFHGVAVPDALLRRMRDVDYRVSSIDEARLEEIESEILDG